MGVGGRTKAVIFFELYSGSCLGLMDAKALHGWGLGSAFNRALETGVVLVNDLKCNLSLTWGGGGAGAFIAHKEYDAVAAY